MEAPRRGREGGPSAARAAAGIPCAQGPGRPEPGEMEEKMERENGLGGTSFAAPNILLVVDDSKFSRAALRKMFEQSYRVVEARDGLEGIKLILQYRQSICAVMLDVVMPNMDGLQVLTALQGSEVMEQVPIFLTTSETRSEILERAYQLGVIDVIQKPFVSYTVQKRVFNIIELYHSRRQLNSVVQQQRERMFQLNLGMVEALATAIEFHCDETGPHVRRIHDITVSILRHTGFVTGLTDEEIELIGMAAVTHDLGKIAIPDAILHKPGRLTKAEFEIMKTHTWEGAKLLASIPQMTANNAYEYAYDIALHHHERWDGGGYPEGLKGDKITPWAQIVSLADVYDALVSKRCYKDAYSFETTMRMILAGECGTFNPALLQEFLKIERDIRGFYHTEPLPAAT